MGTVETIVCGACNGWSALCVCTAGSERRLRTKYGPGSIAIKTGEDQDIFKFVDDEMEAYYNRSPKNAELKYKIRERQTHIVKVDANGQLTLNNKTIAKEDLKEVLKKTMVEHKRLAKEKYNSAEDQVGGVLFSPDTPKEQVKDLLSVMRDAFVEIRADIAQTSGNNSKEYLDKEFPILIGYGDISIKDRKKIHIIILLQ